MQNVDLMGLAGFCRNFLSEWLQEASDAQGNPVSKDDARGVVYGMPYSSWKSEHQQPATPEQLARMEQSLALNETRAQSSLTGRDQFPD